MEETSMSWFSILKKLTGKAKSKGSTLDTDRIKINHYLSQKWGLQATVDSDGDGTNDDTDTAPTTP